MKKILSAFCLVMLTFALTFPCTAFAQEVDVEVPVLKSVEFNNAQLVGEFSASRFDYEIELDESGKTPTLKSYTATDGANVIFTDSVSSNAKGINIEVKMNNVSSNYFFAYVYPDSLLVDETDNYLKEISCELAEVYPKLNEKDTTYSLYIPSDMTELKISAVAQSVGASCEVPGLITLNAEQSPSVKVNVKAADGSVRVYTFNIKRLDKTCEQVEQEMQSENFTSLVDGELFHQKPEFKIILASVIGGIVIILVAVKLLKRLAVKVFDEDEVEFFSFDENVSEDASEQ